MTVELTHDAIRASAVQRKLVKSEENLRATLNSIGEAVMVVDPVFRVTRMNPVAERLTGYSAGEARGRPIDEIVQLAGHDVQQLIEEKTAHDAPVAEPRPPELIHRTGARRCVAFTVSRLCNQEGMSLGAVLILRDMTETLMLEESLRHAHKLDAIGRLAGGVAHDFNNILTAINGQAELLVMELEGQPELEEGARMILESGQRGAELTGQLLDFSRKMPRRWKPLSLHRVVDRAVSMLSRTLGQHIEIVRRLDAGEEVVLGDTAALQNAVLNLGINARDAMPDGGVVEIETRNVTLTAADNSHIGCDLPPGAYVVLSVTDGGAGISPEIRDRIFDPFFTTKELGKGTGLGLAAVYGIAQSHRGGVRVDSGNGGTSFELFLPLHDEPAADTSSPVESGDIPRGRGSILVVDDEPMIRTLLERTLAELGYSALPTSNGDEALAILEGSAATIDAVMLDLMMPGCSGEEVFRRIRERAPELPVLVMTGRADHGALDGVARAAAGVAVEEAVQADGCGARAARFAGGERRGVGERRTSSRTGTGGSLLLTPTPTPTPTLDPHALPHPHSHDPLSRSTLTIHSHDPLSRSTLTIHSHDPLSRSTCTSTITIHVHDLRPGTAGDRR